MRRSLKIQSVVVTVFAFIIVGMVVGCGNGEKLETQISGSYQRTQGDGTVEVNLDKSPMSLVFDGKTYATTIDNVDMGNNTVHLKVATDNGASEEWVLQQRWDDNGSSFKLTFSHGGTQETLVPAGQS
ncbi:MAG: hypothetical protein KFF68_11465 [Desulfosarcina sp.]|nr:hypothetical protein [Desulfosarcina sp.]